jgi:hypothetical protein
MPTNNQLIIGRSEPFNFIENSTLGWQCHCGAAEKIPALSGDLTSIAEPIVTSIEWQGYVRIMLISCRLCGCDARQDTLHTSGVDEVQKGIAR